MKISVERKWKKEGYTIGVLSIDGERICNTLEPEIKKAIPEGYYRVAIIISKKFGARRLILRNVPGHEGILIHEGNTRKDTRGCILVGENSIVGHVQNSKYWLKVINDRVFAALDAHDIVVLRIV